MQLRMGERKPSTVPAGNRYVYYPGGAPQFEYTAVNVKNRSHTITADVEIPEGGAEGVLLAHGSWFAGYSLYVKDRRLRLRAQLIWGWPSTASRRPRTCRRASRRSGFSFTRTGEHRGRGALYIGERLIGEGEIPHTVPARDRDLGRGTVLRLRQRTAGHGRLSRAVPLHRDASSRWWSRSASRQATDAEAQLRAVLTDH